MSVFRAPEGPFLEAGRVCCLASCMRNTARPSRVARFWTLLHCGVGLGLLGVAAAGCSPRTVQLREEHPLLLSDADTAGTLPMAGSDVTLPLFSAGMPDDDAATAAARAAIAHAAGSAVGGGPIVVGGERFRMDCSGVARGIYAKAGHRLGSVSVTGQSNDTRVLFELVRQRGALRTAEPLLGDLVFFNDTWDENGDGVRNDRLSHVGVVEALVSDGTVIFVHRTGDRIVRARMNLAHPHDRVDTRGGVLNHYLRAASGSNPPQTTAELFAGFGSLPLRGDDKLALKAR